MNAMPFDVSDNIVNASEDVVDIDKVNEVDNINEVDKVDNVVDVYNVDHVYDINNLEDVDNIDDIDNVNNIDNQGGIKFFSSLEDLFWFQNFAWNSVIFDNQNFFLFFYLFDL